MELRKVAQKLGFNFQQPLASVSYPPVFQYISETLAKDPRDVDKRSRVLAEKFRQLYPQTSSNNGPALSIDSAELKASSRCGQPLACDYLRIRDAFFYKNIYDIMQPIKLYPTPFAVLRDIFIAFLGRAYEGEKGEKGVEGVEEEGVEEEGVQEEETETLIPLDPHPPGSPPRPPSRDEQNRANESHADPPAVVMEGIYSTPPLATGFEDEICIGPLNRRC